MLVGLRWVPEKGWAVLKTRGVQIILYLGEDSRGRAGETGGWWERESSTIHRVKNRKHPKP